VAARIMPPWLAGPDCAEYRYDRSLGDQQIATIGSWVEQGAAMGDPADEGPPLDGGEPDLQRVDVTLTMPEPYTAQISPDDYRCFLVDWPEQSERFVSGFRANPGNPAVVHHIIAFLIAPETASSFEALDAMEAGPGYTCFGGPGGGVSGLRGVGSIGAWAPGGRGGNLPPGTGIRVRPGSKIALQVHYNTLNSAPAPDQTSLDFQVEQAVDKPGVGLPFVNPQWVIGGTMTIPAGEKDVVHSFSADPSGFLSRIPGSPLVDGQPFVIHGAALHMHTRGTRGKLWITRADGSEECMLDVPRWDFGWQMMYSFVEPKTFHPGEQLSIECHFDNSAENQPIVDGQRLPPQDIAWGEGTTDEMCLGGFFVTAP
jgi:hypothetical protein